MSTQDYKARFEVILKNKSWWSRMLGSQFVEGVSTFIGQMVYRSEQYANRRHQEAFLSTAISRASILAAAEDEGYVGSKVAPANGSATISNITGERLQIPQYSSLESEVGLKYVTMTAIDVPANGSAIVAVNQMYRQSFGSPVEQAEKYMEVILPIETTAKTSRLDVFVQEPNSGAYVQWDRRFMFRRAGPTDRVYAEFYKPTEQLGIRFGNGLAGFVPPAGSSIRLDAWITEGVTTLVDGKELKFSGVSEIYNQRAKVTTLTPVTGGDVPENIEQIRHGAMYITQYDEQVVWDDDYIFFIDKTVPGLTWVNAWGEHKQETQDGAHSFDNVNRIFCSAHSPTESQAIIGPNVLAALESSDKLNKRYSYIDVDYQAFTITLTGTVMPETDAAEVELALRLALEKNYGLNGIDRPERILEKDIWTFIDTLALMTDFVLTIVLPNMPGNPGTPKPVKLNTYQFMDVEKSSLTITNEMLTRSRR